MSVPMSKMHMPVSEVVLTADSCVMQDMGEVEVDFPFRVSPSEQAIIENDPDPPCSIVLVGRSGTGKTTCAVFRMWARWLTFRHHSAESFHQVIHQPHMLPS